MHSGFGSESWEFKQIHIRPGSEVDAFCGVSKSMFKEYGKKDSKQCMGKDTALFHATKDVDGVGSGTIVQTVPFMLSWKDFTIPSRVGGQPFLARIL